MSASFMHDARMPSGKGGPLRMRRRHAAPWERWLTAFLLVTLAAVCCLMALPRHAKADQASEHAENDMDENLVGKQDLVPFEPELITFISKGSIHYGNTNVYGSAITPVFEVRGEGPLNAGLLFCANHDKTEPYYTTYRAWQPYVDTVFNPNNPFTVDDLKAVLYFGYGGPGYDRSLFPSPTYASSKESINAANEEEKIYAYTHMLVHYVYNGEWENALKNELPDFRQWATTNLIDDSKGTATIQKILARKNEVPAGFKAFLLDSEYDHNFQQLVGYLSPAYILVDKQDEHGNPLPGAIFGVYADKDCAKKVCSMASDSSGRAKSPDLPAGTYWVREDQPPAGYQGDTTVREAHAGTSGTSHFVLSNSLKGVPFELQVSKVDAETGTSGAVGAGSLAGARFEIRFWYDKYSAAQVAGQDPSRTWFIETDEEGRARLAADCLADGSNPLYLDDQDKAIMPVGFISLRETRAPKGYRLSSEERSLFICDYGDGDLEVTTFQGKAADAPFPNQPIRGDLAFDKADAETKEPMAHVPFLITSKTTGERHVIISDKNGLVDTSANRLSSTNKNDGAWNEETGFVDADMLDDAAGVWFSGTSQASSQPYEGASGSLPYDAYAVRELPCRTNEAHALASFEFEITEDGARVSRGTVYDQPQRISTSASISGARMAPPDEKLTVSDTVSYEGLEPGRTYTLQSAIHVRAPDGSDAGMLEQVPPQAMSFSPAEPSGEVEVSFELDGTRLAGSRLVCFETLSEEGRTICAHENIADDQQTVRITRLTTSAYDRSGGAGDKEVAGIADQIITDAVTYEGLIPGETYELAATLHRKANDGSDTGPVMDDAGEVLRITTSFVPESENGTACLDMPIKADLLSGQELVVFEQVLHDGVLVARHEDISDAAQTVLVSEPPLPTGTSSGLPQTGEFLGGAAILAGLGSISAFCAHAIRHARPSRSTRRRRR